MPRLAVIGHPVSHSRSPAMQTAALEALGLADDGATRRSTSPRRRFEMTVREMAANGFAGANVTVPHKEAALALADTPSEAAREIGAANTLVFADGRIEAHNTDADGLLAALPSSPREQRDAGPGRRRRGPGRGLGAGRDRARGSRSGTARPPGPRAICAELGGTPRRRSRPDRLRADRQHQRRRPRRRGPLRAPAAAPRSVRRRPDGSRHGLRGRAAARCWTPPRSAGADRRRRARGPGPAGRPVAANLDRTRAADRRRCAPPPVGRPALMFSPPIGWSNPSVVSPIALAR